MGVVGGVILLVIGLVLTVVGRQRTDGTSILRISSSLEMIYPVTCLAFIAFGLAFIIGS
jgi:hypothetical protein